MTVKKTLRKAPLTICLINYGLQTNAAWAVEEANVPVKRTLYKIHTKQIKTGRMPLDRVDHVTAAEIPRATPLSYLASRTLTFTPAPGTAESP